MKISRLAAVIMATLALSGCGMVGRMLQAGGRTLHLNSEGAKTPEDFRLDARTVREALAAARPPAGPEEAAADAVARR